MSVMANADTNKGVAPPEVAPGDKSTKSSIVELRNGKLVLKQKILSFEKMSETMQEIVKFREMLEQRLEAKQPPLEAVPDEHKPVIAKLVQESDKTLQALSKHVQQQLLPAVDEEEDEDDTAAAILPLEAVEDAIKSMAKRVNYGLDNPAEGGKVPAAWLLWRWELSDSCREWLPRNAKEKVDNRLRERQQAKLDVKTLFESLPEEERNSILVSKPGARATLKVKSGTKGIPGANIVDLTDSEPSARQLPPHPAGSENNAPESKTGDDASQEAGEKKGPGRPKKPVDSEKAAERAAKEKERLEKKTAKAEREKKEQAAQEKSRSLMANFFGKTKSAANPNASPSKAGPSSEGAHGSPAPVVMQSDFERVFRPFALKKGADLAPINWFRESKARRQRRQTTRIEVDVIVIEDDEESKVDEDVEMTDVQEVDIWRNTSPEDRIRYVLSRLPSGLNPPRRPKQPTGYKTYWPISVRGLMGQLTEAEVAGDDEEVRRLLSILRSRRALPAKAFVFHEDARPGYFGTFTRSSREVGPRTPFAKDVVAVDYAYDSGEEWAEEDAGEADDVVEGDVEEDDGDEGEDSELDDWLVDDDEVEEPGTPIEERMGSPDFDFPPLQQPGKRKKEKDKAEGGTSKKRRVVVPLVPYSKGPEWESVIGRCTYGPFNPYRIQLLNDTPFPIDPFTYVEQPTDLKGHPQQTTDGFVIPALPAHLAKSTSSTSPLVAPATSTPGAGPSTTTPKRGVPAPKTAFPDAHLPHLLARIEALATSSLQCIVETVHRELQAHRVKKNAIEAKVREVGEKSKERKVWVVRPDIKAQHGMA
ncbi:hypothetical protein BD413DRAFT_21920 [Trametes elegans]|nr:hypothetical protein BD413DRAFT_21920 [Trametes elegans]